MTKSLMVRLAFAAAAANAIRTINFVIARFS